VHNSLLALVALADCVRATFGPSGHGNFPIQTSTERPPNSGSQFDVDFMYASQGIHVARGSFRIHPPSDGRTTLIAYTQETFMTHTTSASGVLRRVPTRSPSASTLGAYVQSIHDALPMTETESDCVVGQLNGPEDKEARAALVRSHLRFVITIAKQHVRAGIDIMDLVAEGNVALMRAAQMFDASRGVSFASYALPWIRHAIRGACVDRHAVIRIPKAARRLIATYNQWTTSHPDESASVREVATMLNVSRDMAGVVVESSRRRRLDMLTSTDSNEQSSLATLAFPQHDDPAERINAREQLAGIRAALASLSPADQELIELHFGLDGQRALSEAAISRRLSMPLVRVVANLRRAMDQLRATLSKRQVA